MHDPLLAVWPWFFSDVLNHYPIRHFGHGQSGPEWQQDIAPWDGFDSALAPTSSDKERRS
ncbi:hypothetical protein PT2222_80099 [Paraburkholderia tropica]